MVSRSPGSAVEEPEAPRPFDKARTATETVLEMTSGSPKKAKRTEALAVDSCLRGQHRNPPEPRQAITSGRPTSRCLNGSTYRTVADP